MLCGTLLLRTDRKRLSVDMNLANQRRAIKIVDSRLRRIPARQREADEACQLIIRRNIGNEMLLRHTRRIDEIIEPQRFGPDRFSAHLATSHTLTLRPASLHLIVNVLS